jgi:choice-of-anchor A domain-containing protein
MDHVGGILRRFLGIYAVVLLMSAGSARATGYLYSASPYNVFVQNNFTLNGSDVVGGVAAGGTISVGSVSLASGTGTTLFPGGYSVIGATDVLATSGSMNGNLYDGTAGGISSGFTVHGSVTDGDGNPDSAPIDFPDAFHQLDSLSTSLASQAATGSDSCSNYYGTITCTAGNSGLNVIDVPAGAGQSGTGGTVNSYDLGHNYGIVIDITTSDPNVTLVINVMGTSAYLGGAGFTVNGNFQKVLFNFPQAQTLVLGSSAITASVLAPLAAVTAGGGNLDGNFIALSMTQGTTEFHDDLFTGVLPQPPSATPEPLTGAMIGGGLLLLLGWRRRRR